MSDTAFEATPFRVVHPLDDMPEAKLYRDDLGRMRLTPGVRLSLLLLRFYLLLMLGMVLWRALQLAAGG